MSEKMVKLRFIDHVLDGNGNPVPHATKPGQWARHGGQIPLIDKETGYPRSVFPGEMFEVDKHIADDLLQARPGVIVLEAEYQKRAVKIESRRVEVEAQRDALAAVYKIGEKRKAARARLAQQIETAKADSLREDLEEAQADRPGAPWQQRRDPDAHVKELGQLRAEMTAERQASEARIRDLEAKLLALAEAKAPAGKPAAVEDKDEGGDKGKRK
jgi:hypothetical protein